eukprot:g223.t1
MYTRPQSCRAALFRYVFPLFILFSLSLSVSFPHLRPRRRQKKVVVKKEVGKVPEPKIFDGTLKRGNHVELLSYDNLKGTKLYGPFNPFGSLATDGDGKKGDGKEGDGALGKITVSPLPDEVEINQAQTKQGLISTDLGDGNFICIWPCSTRNDAMEIVDAGMIAFECAVNAEPISADPSCNLSSAAPDPCYQIFAHCKKGEAIVPEGEEEEGDETKNNTARPRGRS